jgi:hypothetical protein
MAYADYDDLRPDRVRDVEVLVGGEWQLGDLEATYKLDGVWRGRVRYSRGPGKGNYLGWFSEPNIRRPVSSQV